MAETNTKVQAPYREKRAFHDTNIWRKMQAFYNIYIPINKCLPKEIKETIGKNIITNMLNVIECMNISYNSKKLCNKYKNALQAKDHLRNTDVAIKTLYAQRLLNIRKVDIIIKELANIATDLNRWINAIQKEFKQNNNNSNSEEKLNNSAIIRQDN